MLRFGQSVVFKEGMASDVELNNFWPPEDGFVWSQGRWSELIFPFADIQSAKAHCELVLDMDVYKHPPELEAQNVLVYLNGLRVGSRLISKQTTAFLDFDPTILKLKDNIIVFDTPDSQRPSAFSGTDSRLLGVQLFSLEIRTFASI